MQMPVTERLGHHVKRVEQELIALKQAALKPAGLTVAQYTVLVVLAQNPGASAAALARLCLVTPQTVATILTNLEGKGLVVRTPHPYHRNATETRLTEAGEETLATADAAAVRIERRLGDAFTAEERGLLIELLGRCSTTFHAMAEEVDGGRGVLAPFRGASGA
ncbi:MarR family winged helix-turn-helix transcriptional regulator [Streptomyces sp. WMMC1477]|uniref:MarR family winged helix-turn-helix transcriptional regulator n=1 Tax=Streptomyces sp. WMMC1477 TaxID=3015155 RepID=UPI0022B6EC3A|nr:MarR family transcriptional regulator [Streptomyces sp. WMMC1477]MCZ7432138.1 MarR family transcriptional regulator [Streptomyces sp. WMMC1477]